MIARILVSDIKLRKPLRINHHSLDIESHKDDQIRMQKRVGK
jgi:hypothetical protein